MISRISHILAVLMMVLGTFVPAIAHGKTTVTTPEVPDEKLRTRYEEAAKLMQNNKPAQACPILEEVVMSAPRYSAAKQALADCYELGGKLLSASRLYEAIEKEAAAEGQDVARSVASDKRRSLAPRLSHLRIVVPQALSQTAALVILHDGEKVSREQWGEAVPADRGPHKVEAFVMGEKVWSTVKDVWEEGGIQEVLIDLHPPYLGNKREGTYMTTRREKNFWTVGRSVGLTIGSFGVLALGTGAVFGGIAHVKRDESMENNHCDVTYDCNQVGYDLWREARSYRNATTALIVTGSILTGIGATVFLVSPAKPSSPIAMLDVGPSGILVRGQF